MSASEDKKTILIDKETGKLLSRSEYYARRTELDPKICMLCSGEQVVLQDMNNWTWVAALAPYWKFHTMLVPKRHISRIKELNVDEWHEFLMLQERIVEIYRDSGLKFTDGTKLENVLIFWRHRYQLYNPKLKANNVDHLHVHFACDREHFLDPISDEDASAWEIKTFLGKLQIS
jgi:diadenosine tetraphosphate (Ap4A) HIT family hydrolase